MISPGLGVIFFINPENKNSVLYLAACLEQRLPDVPLWLCNPDTEKGRKVLADHGGARATVFLFSFTSFSRDANFRLLRLMKKKQAGKQAVFAAGGVHPTVAPEECLSAGFDLVFRGEGEASLPKIIGSLLTRGTDIPSAPRGVIEQKDPACLDSWIPYLKKYNSFMPVELMRGCPYECGFCLTPRVSGRRVRQRSPENVLRTASMMDTSTRNYMRFIAPNSFSYLSAGIKDSEGLSFFLKELRGTLGRQGKIYFGTFPSEVRPEWVTAEKLSLVGEFCDNRSVSVGIQSGSDRILGKIKRGHTAAQAAASIEALRGSGLAGIFDFMTGFPGEDALSFRETADMMEYAAGSGGSINLHYFMPLPGTEMEDQKPVSVPGDIRRRYKALEKKGRLKGKWEYQEKTGSLRRFRGNVPGTIFY